MPTTMPGTPPTIQRITLALASLLATTLASAASSPLLVSASTGTTCAVVSGAAYCWGHNGSGQVGNASTTDALAPAPVSGLGSGVSAIVTGGAHSCAVVNGGAWCWGNNDYGQLGNNAAVDSPVPVPVSGLATGVTDIAAGDLHTCAVAGGGVKCWGSGGYGQLGTGATVFSSAVPVAVTGMGSGVAKVTAGRFHSCAIASGAAWCWGRGESGEIGDGLGSATAPAPVAVSGFSGTATAVSAGGYFTCGVRNAGAKCWGFGGSGQLGNNATANSAVPQQVAGLAAGVGAISAGNGLHACAIAGGAVQCWGYNNHGQLGNPGAGGGSLVPVPVLGLSGVQQAISAGGLHTCAAGDAGIHCWGDNANGQLGTGNRTASGTAVLVIPAPVVATALSSDPASLDFGGQSLNTTSPARTATITNNGGVAVTFTDAAAPSVFSGTHDCATLAPGASCSVTLQFTPVATGAVNGSVVFVTSAGTFAIAATGTGEQSLVTHYYRSILRRAPDAGGKAYWESEAGRMQSLGANVNETWYAMAGAFYASAEYLAFGRDDAGFVTDLYNTFFNRAPDAAGLAYWTGLLGGGLPREVALVSFMFSAEFTTFTQAIFGSSAVRAEIDTVVDFYRGLLGRLPDDGGFAYWVQQFRAAQCLGGAAVNAQAEAISSLYAQSAEYGARGRTHAQYVGDLYNGFLRRGGDLAGVQFWIGQVASGAQTREQVRRQFVASPEFQGRVAAIIAQGCLP